MKNRFIPFGYRMQGGIMELHPLESEIIKDIYSKYLAGASLKSIADDLCQKGIEYLPGKYDWNKNRIKRIIEDIRYLGNTTYPPITDTDMHHMALLQKDSSNTQKNTNRADGFYQIKTPIICDCCNSEMERIHDIRCKNTELHRCTNPYCAIKVKIPDLELMNSIRQKLNVLIDDPALAEQEFKVSFSDPSIEVKRLDNEIGRLLDNSSFDKEQLKKSILECAAKKYEDIKSARHIWNTLKADFEKSSPLSKFNYELFEKTVSQIRLSPSENVYLVLKNGTVIGKEY
jgi:site-specific DNA recombinase